MRARLGVWLSMVAMVAALTVAGASTAFAEPWPVERFGWTAGFGLGGGGLSFDVDDALRTDREVGAFMTMRGGYGLHEHVVIGLEMNGWFSDVNGVEWIVGTIAPYVSWHPGTSGVYLRTGLGVSSADATYQGPGGTVEASDSGVGGFAALGWEFRVLRTVALHPEVMVTYANLGDGVAADGVHVSTGMSWYWGDRSGR